MLSGSQNSFGRVQLKVKKQVLLDNFNIIRKLAGNCNILTVLKANAYGTGDQPLSLIARQAGTDRIGVADMSEALHIRQSVGDDIPIQILGVVSPGELPEAVKTANMVLPVEGLAMAQAVSAEAARQGKTVKIHVIIDTGMGRFGLLKDNFAAEILAIKALPNLEVEGIYSHFPCAGTPGEAGTVQQIEDFKNALHELRRKGVEFDLRHLAASDGILCQEPARCEPFNMVRLGLCWYGLNQDAAEKSAGLQRSLELTTCVGAVRKMPANATIGYNRTCTLKRDTMVATICAGYADGLPLALSNAGRVLINGVSCPVLGRVSMDYTMVDVSNVPGNVAWGTAVTLLGRDGDECIEFTEWAKFKNTHVHDILCALGNRVERVYC